MTSLQVVIVCILLFFVVNLFFIVRFHIKQDTFEAYSVGNRSFGWLLFSATYIGYWFVGSIYISWFSTAALVGVFAQYILVYSMGSFIILYFMAKPVWVWGKIYNLETQADLIGLRYGSERFKLVFSILTFFLWFPWLILEMRTIGYSIAVATGSFVDFNLGMVIVCLYVIMYTFYGGVRGSAIACAVQVALFGGVGLVVVSLLIGKTYGSIGGIFRLVETSVPELLVLQPAYGGLYWSSVIITGTLGAFCLPGMFRLLYFAKGQRIIKKASCTVPLVVIPNIWMLLSVGLGGVTLSGFLSSPEISLFWIAESYGGSLMLGMFAVFALSASMSTMSAIISSAAVIISKDWLGFKSKAANRKELLRNAKAATIVIGIVSLYLASIEIPNLLSIALLMYDCVVQAFVPVFIGQYWKKSNLRGASLGMMIGIAIAIIGNLVPSSIVWANGWSAGMIGLSVNLLIHFICGQVFGKQMHADEIFSVLENYKER